MSNLVSQSQRSVVFFDEDHANNQRIVWKICSPQKHTTRELANEFALVQSLSITGIRKAIKQGIYQNKEAFAYAYFDGVSLKNYCTSTRLSVDEAVLIFLHIVATLKEVHQQGICHFRVNSHNILYQPETATTQLIDFSVATRHPGIQQLDFQEYGQELAYIAPEQTGRLQQIPDSRSDLYSAGIVLYELLTSQLPFTNDDSLQIVHFHLVQIPTAPHEINPDIPPILSSIVSKLLAKNPDDRYQTASSLEQDLRQFLDEHIAGRPSTLTELGLFDQKNRWQLSENLYGRDAAINQLLAGYDKAANGDKQFCLLSGEKGTGKTKLLANIKPLIEAQGGLVLLERFDNVPTYTPSFGLTDLADTLLSQSVSGLDEWATMLKTAVGQQTQALVGQIPAFKWVLDTDDSEVHSAEEPINMAVLFQKLLRSRGQLKQPVVLLIDDMQWDKADFWSSVSVILADSSITHLLLIATEQKPEYLPTDTSTTQPWQTLLRSHKHTIPLSPLPLSDVEDFIRDSLQVSHVGELASLAFTKTQGNPYYLREFLNRLHDQKTCWFDLDQGNWRWDIAKVAQHKITDNVVAQVIASISDLPPVNQQVVQYAACLGNTIDVTLLSQLLNKDPQVVDSMLISLVRAHFFNRQDTHYVFTHEAIREVIYMTIPASEKETVHYRIALLLPENESASTKESLVNRLRHYNLGQNHIPQGERFLIATLNLQAGLDARQKGDFTGAYGYFTNGLRLVEAADWEIHYETMLHLHHEATETGLITGAVEEADQWLQESLRKARTLTDRIKAHEIKLNQLSENHQFPETVSHLLKVLDEIGYGIRRNPSKLTILKEFARVKWRLRTIKIADLPTLPLMEDERAKAFMKLTINSSTSIFGNAPDIVPIVAFRQIYLSLKYGNSEYSPFSYSSYGYAILAFMNDLHNGYEFGKVALQLVDVLGAEVVRTKVMVVFYGFLSFWKTSFRESIAPLRQAYHIGRQQGDLLYASFALSFHDTIRLHVGDQLADLLPTMTDDCLLLKEMNQPLVYVVTEVQRQVVINLVHVTVDPLVLGGELYEQTLLQQLKEVGDDSTQFNYLQCKLMVAIIFNDYQKGFTYSEESIQYEEEASARVTTYPTFLLLSGIAYIKQLSTSQSAGITNKIRKKITKRLRLLDSFARYAPQNFKAKALILRGLFTEQQGSRQQAIDQYQAAIKEAQASGHIHEEALAREHMAYFLLKTGQTEFGEVMLQKSFRCYEKWGALAKCNQLATTYPYTINELINTGKGISIANFQNKYDLNTIIYANQVLSSENNSDGLLKRMVEIVIQNASATNVVILLKTNTQQVQPKAVGTNHSIDILSPDTASTQQMLYPATVVNYVTRSRVSFVSPNLSTEKSFAFDPYTQQHSPLSVCCIPIIANENLLGVLYLENNLAESAFDAQRVNFFATISAQLAISLDNVFLYEEMEQKVEQRTAELEQSLAHLKATQNQLIQAEKMASLGELTAGIAHEIQNPLNFVNNFSEVSVELVQELIEGPMSHIPESEKEYADEILGDLTQNLERITYHGKRADAIVKGMLEHSRTSTGQKQLTDINALTDEYLRLAYHGLRAKNKTFNATLITDFEPDLGKINVLPQDLSRVLLNLYNNAFYAIQQKSTLQDKNGLTDTAGYLPQLTVRTRYTDTSKATVDICIKDNGVGIPADILSKVYQPFFTTKPTGEGTGLGLSLSYDIVTKGHGGSISIDTEAGQFTEVIVRLPS